MLVPTYVCNVLGRPIFEEYDVVTNFSSTGGLKDRNTGGSAGLFDFGPLIKLWLVGQPKGKTSLDPDGLYMVHANWSSAEKARWKMHKLSLSNKPTAGPTSAVNPAYTSAEKAWLKRAFGGEYKFLSLYSLSIHTDVDRAEGRAIAREMIEHEAAVESDGNEEDDDSEETDSFTEDLENDPTSHLADHHFSGQELDWIKKHYRHSGNFMLSYGLKPFEDEDCEDAVAIVRAMMDGGED